MTENKNSELRSIEEMSFEECYDELRVLVDKFEQGQMPLAESVDRFERGMLLLQRCSHQLGAAEKRVETLLQRIEPEKMADDELFDSNQGH